MKTSPWLIATVAVVLAGCGGDDDTDWAGILAPKPGSYPQVAGTYTGRAAIDFYVGQWASRSIYGSGRAVVVQSDNQVTMKNGSLAFEREFHSWEMDYGILLPAVRGTFGISGRPRTVMFESELGRNDANTALPAVTGTIDRIGTIRIAAIDRTGVIRFKGTQTYPIPTRDCGVFTVTRSSLSYPVGPVGGYAGSLEFRELYHSPLCEDVRIYVRASLRGPKR